MRVRTHARKRLDGPSDVIRASALTRAPTCRRGVLSQLAPERVRSDAEDARRLLAVARQKRKDAQDVPPLNLGQRQELAVAGRAARRARDLRRQVGLGDLRLALASTTARSIACSSSRTLPGQS